MYATQSISVSVADSNVVTQLLHTLEAGGEEKAYKGLSSRSKHIRPLP